MLPPPFARSCWFVLIFNPWKNQPHFHFYPWSLNFWLHYIKIAYDVNLDCLTGISHAYYTWKTFLWMLFKAQLVLFLMFLTGINYPSKGTWHELAVSNPVFQTCSFSVLHGCENNLFLWQVFSCLYYLKVLPLNVLFKFGSWFCLLLKVKWMANSLLHLSPWIPYYRYFVCLVIELELN